MTNNFELYFLNNGDIILQTENYCHCYNDAAIAATDVSLILDGESMESWDGNEPEYRMEYDCDAECRGDYVHYTHCQLQDILDGDLYTTSGNSERLFLNTLID